jgi:UDP-glucose 4-epimerase
MPGSPIQPDQKIADIVRAAMKNEVISVIKNDGTQFIGVEDLVKLYNDVLLSEYNRSIFFGVGSRYITWEEIARYAIDYIGSESAIKFDDRGWEKGRFMYDYTSLNRFSFEAHTTNERLHRHIRYLADLEMRLIRHNRA